MTPELPELPPRIDAAAYPSEPAVRRPSDAEHEVIMVRIRTSPEFRAGYIEGLRANAVTKQQRLAVLAYESIKWGDTEGPLATRQVPSDGKLTLHGTETPGD